MRASDASALVTGAAGGIGADVARVLAAAGTRVLLADRDASVLQLAEDLPGAVGYVVDLAYEQDVLALARHATEVLGGCDILVNNAGINPKIGGRGYKTEEIDMAVWNDVLQINLTAPFLLCRELLPPMRHRGWGRVVNIGSRAGRTYVAGVSAFYSASKAGLVGLTRQLAGEYAAFGVTVNCVAPGPVVTPLASQSSTEVRAKVTGAIPAGRAATAGEIASVVAFLVSPAASYLCGACIDVNGGGFIG